MKTRQILITVTCQNDDGVIGGDRPRSAGSVPAGFTISYSDVPLN